MTVEHQVLAPPESEPATGGSVEAARLAAVARYEILDTPPDAAFDRIAGLAARLLQAPMATVSIVDTDRIWFKATHGLEGLDQLGRDPGLCASAIEHDGPHVLHDASRDPSTAGNPLVHGETGVRFYAGAPLTTSDGHRLGTLNVLDTRPRQVSETELATLTDLAAVVMDELEVRLSALSTLREETRARRRAEDLAATLQRTLLPPSLPRVPGLELACHYYAASSAEVTGDFYDVFSLGDGRWAFFLGDVTGHGAAAATVASLARYTLRTSALHASEPAAVLEELNAALLMDPNVPQHCTVLFGILHPDSDGGFEVTMAGGGHPPALRITAATGTVDEVWPEGGMLVGALPDASFVTCRARLDDGQTLLLYTDGLTEARPDGKFFGEQGLKSSLASRPHACARDQISELITLLDGFDPGPTDDVALLALTARGASTTRE